MEHFLKGVMKLFGTDGIRGKANEFPMTPELAMRLGRILPGILGASAPRVVLGRDTRVSGSMLEGALTSGLLSGGAEVSLAGVVPTPAVAFLTGQQGFDAGIMLTASHNPFEDNGIKIFGPNGRKLSDEQEAELESALAAEPLAFDGRTVGELKTLGNAPGLYLEFAQKSAGGASLAGRTVVLDCANGAGHQVGPLLFSAMGAKVVSLGITPNGKNINEACGSLHPEEAARVVREVGADLGVCLDGDGDRLTVIDETGAVVAGDRLLYLAALALKKRGLLKRDTLVATVMSNLGLKAALAREGISLETTGVGDRLVLERMCEGGFSLGGENSGHVIFADYASTGDGLVTALQVLVEMAATGQTLSQLAQGMELYPQKLINLQVTAKPPLGDIPGLEQAITDAEDELGDEGRVLVRYSGTEKKMRVMVESRSEDLAEKWSKALAEVVNQTLGC